MHNTIDLDLDFNLDLDLVLDLNLKQRRTLTSNFASTPINGLHPVGILTCVMTIMFAYMVVLHMLA